MSVGALKKCESVLVASRWSANRARRQRQSLDVTVTYVFLSSNTQTIFVERVVPTSSVNDMKTITRLQIRSAMKKKPEKQRTQLRVVL